MQHGKWWEVLINKEERGRKEGVKGEKEENGMEERRKKERRRQRSKRKINFPRSSEAVFLSATEC